MLPLALVIAILAAGAEIWLARQHLIWLRKNRQPDQGGRTTRQTAALMLGHCALALAGAGGLAAVLAQTCGPAAALPVAVLLPLAVDALLPLGRRQLARAGWRVLLALPVAALAGWIITPLGDLAWLAGWAMWLAWALTRELCPTGRRLSPAPAELSRFSGVTVMVAPNAPQLNARAEGILCWRRIVLNDSILTTLPAPAVAAIIAHESGHLAGRHGEKYLAWRAGQMLALLAIAQALGLADSPLSSAVLLILLARPLAFVLRPLETKLLQHWEFQADAHAASLIGTEAMAAALRGLFTANATALAPHPLYTLFHSGHPAPAERLRRLTPTP